MRGDFADILPVVIRNYFLPERSDSVHLPRWAVRGVEGQFLYTFVLRLRTSLSFGPLFSEEISCVLLIHYSKVFYHIPI